jgi:hypothetical protein
VTFEGLQAFEMDVEVGVALDVEELKLVGDDVVEELLLDVEDEGPVLAMAASAPLPCTGIASGSVKGDPTSHTGWSWPGETTRELQQYELTPDVLLRRMMEHPLWGWASRFGVSLLLRQGKAVQELRTCLALLWTVLRCPVWVGASSSSKHKRLLDSHTEVV